MSRLLKEDGFSLMEIMIAAGMLGVITLGVLKLNDMQTKSAKIMSNQLTEGEIFRRITINLADSPACVKTLKNIKEQHAIFGKNGKKLFKIGDKIAGVVIKNIDAANITGSGNRAVKITVQLARLRRKGGAQIINKFFSVDAQYKNGVVTTCYLDKENIISTAIAQVQKSLSNGTMKFKELNIETPDGKTGIRFENDKLIIKGDVAVEDRQGNMVPLTDYIVEQITKKMIRQQTSIDGNCKEHVFTSNRSIPIRRCSANPSGDKNSCPLEFAPNLKCTCSATVAAGKNGDTKSLRCQSTATALSAAICSYEGDKQGCETNSSVRIKCPSYFQRVKCMQGEWVRI